jgi:hypothetical protein
LKDGKRIFQELKPLISAADFRRDRSRALSQYLTAFTNRLLKVCEALGWEDAPDVLRRMLNLRGGGVATLANLIRLAQAESATRLIRLAGT